jgi:hypothetical protein
MAVSFSNHWWGKEKNQKNILWQVEITEI